MQYGLYTIIEALISYTGDATTFGNTERQIIMGVSGALILLITVTLVDLLYRVFSHFWRG